MLLCFGVKSQPFQKHSAPQGMIKNAWTCGKEELHSGIKAGLNRKVYQQHLAMLSIWFQVTVSNNSAVNKILAVLLERAFQLGEQSMLCWAYCNPAVCHSVQFLAHAIKPACT